MAKLDEAGINYRAFREPDLNNEITALATEPISGQDRSFFNQFQLLGQEQSSPNPPDNANAAKEVL